MILVYPIIRIIKRQIKVLVHGTNQSLSVQLHKKCETKEVNGPVADYVCCITDECAALPEDTDLG